MSLGISIVTVAGLGNHSYQRFAAGFFLYIRSYLRPDYLDYQRSNDSRSVASAA